MKNIFFSFCLLMCLQSYSQFVECDCSENYDSLSHSVEANYIAFHDRIESSKTVYDSMKLRIKKSVFNERNFYNCFKHLDAYLRWFNDPHLNIALKRDSSLNEVYKNTFIKSPTISKSSKKSTDNIIGLYKSAATNHIIEIVMSDDKYYGTIVKADSIFWFPKQVKFVLGNNHSGKATYYYEDRISTKIDYFYHSDTLILIGLDVFKKIKSINEASSVNFNFYLNASFKNLSDSTSYLSLPTFEWDQKVIIDSLLIKHEKELNSKPYLIVDLRNNGGGFSSCFNKLLPYIYSKPIIIPPSQFIASKENVEMRVKIYEKYLEKSPNNDYLKRQISLLQSNIGKMVEPHGTDTLTWEQTLKNPRKIVILIDDGVASAAEHLIFYSQKSDKVIIMGQNTAGAFNTLEVMGERYLPSPFFRYYCPAGRLLNIPNLNKIGFSPNIYLDLKDYNHWVNSAQKFLEKHETY